MHNGQIDFILWCQKRTPTQECDELATQPLNTQKPTIKSTQKPPLVGYGASRFSMFDAALAKKWLPMLGLGLVSSALSLLSDARESRS
jgi:hypothetical protein